MGLPDPDSARTWGGKVLVDRDGAEIGILTEIFLDDATGLPEWATTDVGSGSAFIPLVDAVESGERVRVAVRGIDVADAPRVGDVRHLSEDEEERLYRHYGIEYSRSDSQSGLPADAASSAAPTDSSSTSTSPQDSPTPVTAEPAVTGGTPSTQPRAAEPAAAEAATSETPHPRRGRTLLLLLGLGVVGALSAIAGAVLRSRRRRQPPLSRAERLAARARASSSVLDKRRRQAVAAAVPVLQTGSRLSITAAQRAAIQAATQATAAAEQAAALAARVARLPRASRPSEAVGPTPMVVARGDARRMRALTALKTAVSFGAGYVLGSQAGRTRLEQVKQTTASWSQQPAVQQAGARVRAVVPDTLHAGNARLAERASTIAGKVRRHPDGDGASSPGHPAS
jgi:hypothetical protein